MNTLVKVQVKFRKYVIEGQRWTMGTKRKVVLPTSRGGRSILVVGSLAATYIQSILRKTQANTEIER